MELVDRFVGEVHLHCILRGFYVLQIVLLRFRAC